MTSGLYSFNIVLLVVLGNSVISLRITSLSVPTSADPRFEVPEMSCTYEFGAEGLYTVKWYKDDREFYRFLPTYDPQIIYFPSEDVTLSEGGFLVTKTTLEKRTASRSVCNTTACSVRLVNMTAASSGEYSCEISSERPYFNTDVKYANFTVTALPRFAPTIKGVSASYSPGDELSATCTSDVSLPESLITWSINGDRPPREALRSYGSTPPDFHGLRRSTSELRFRVDDAYFRGESFQFNISCFASVPNINISMSSHTIFTLDGHRRMILDNQKLEWNRGCGISSSFPFLMLGVVARFTDVIMLTSC